MGEAKRVVEKARERLAGSEELDMESRGTPELTGTPPFSSLSPSSGVIPRSRRHDPARAALSGPEAGDAHAATPTSTGAWNDEEQLRLALECGRMVAWEIEASTGRTTLRGNTADVLGVYPEHDTGLLEMDRIYPDDRAAMVAAMAHVLAGGPAMDTEFRWIRPVDGEITWLEGRAGVVRDESGNVVGMRGLLADITARKRSEELRARAAELELENHRMEETVRVKNAFLARMSHELRTPLNAIIGFSELLYDGHVEPGSPQHKEFLGDIVVSGQRLLMFIDELLDMDLSDDKDEAKPPDASTGPRSPDR